MLGGAACAVSSRAPAVALARLLPLCACCVLVPLCLGGCFSGCSGPFLSGLSPLACLGSLWFFLVGGLVLWAWCAWWLGCAFVSLGVYACLEGLPLRLPLVPPWRRWSACGRCLCAVFWCLSAGRGWSFGLSARSLLGALLGCGGAGFVVAGGWVCLCLCGGVRVIGGAAFAVPSRALLVVLACLLLPRLLCGLGSLCFGLFWIGGAKLVHAGRE